MEAVARKQKILFIINPISGIYKKQFVPAQIEKIIDKSRFKVDMRFTEYRGHAISIARDAAMNLYDIVVAVGGDGSVNEIVNGIAGTETALGIIPLGSGNGLAGHLKIPFKVKKALQIINTAKIDQIDLGKANHRYFASNAGVGLVSVVAEKFAKQKIRGFFSYIYVTLTHYLPYRSEKIRMIVDGDEFEREMMFVVVSNSNQLGYSISASPRADLKDGKLDVCIVDKINKARGFYLVGRAFLKKLDNLKGVEIRHAKNVSIFNSKPGMMQLDGEFHPWTEDLHISIKEKFLKVIVP